jgi:hypothetical protein
MLITLKVVVEEPKMVTTVASGFQRLRENLEIAGLQKENVSARQQNVRAAIELELNVLESFLSGSYARATMIAPLAEADIDIFNVLDTSYYSQDGQATLLDRLKRVLQRTYPNTPAISRNGQAVTISFTDFTVDVVPAFNRNGGGYLIPDTVNKVWINTDPKVHADLISQENAEHNGDLVPLVKMIKGWNRTINYAFESFYLELMAMEVFKGVTISDYASGTRYFFDKGREKIRHKIKDPVEYGGWINPLRNVATVEDAVSRFETAYSRAYKGEQFDLNGRSDLAIDEWRKIFGDYFPTYG